MTHGALVLLEEWKDAIKKEALKEEKPECCWIL